MSLRDKIRAKVQEAEALRIKRILEPRPMTEWDKARLAKIKMYRLANKPNNELRGDIYSLVKLGCYKKPRKPGGCQEGGTLYELVQTYKIAHKVEAIEKAHKELAIAGYICKVGHKRGGEDVWVVSCVDPKTGEIP